jgi:hypothetical protein
MRTILFFTVLLASCVLAAAMPVDPTLQQMTPDEQIAYRQYVQQLQLEQQLQQDPYFMFQEPAVEVTCPSGTRGLSVPKIHRNFWNKLKLTRSLQWSADKKLLCVPVKMRQSLTPIIRQLKTEKMINVDPLTVPGFMDKVQQKETEIIEQMLLAGNEIWTGDNEFDTIDQDGMVPFDLQGVGGLGGFGGFGRFGRFGFGRFGGLGWGLGLGFGYPGFGYGAWGYPGINVGYYGGWGYPGVGLGFGGLGYGRLGWGGFGYPGFGLGIVV